MNTSTLQSSLRHGSASYSCVLPSNSQQVRSKAMSIHIALKHARTIWLGEEESHEGGRWKKKNNSQWSRVHYSCHFERTGLFSEYKWSGKILPFEWHFLWPMAQIVRMCHFSKYNFSLFFRMRKKTANINCMIQRCWGSALPWQW